MGSLLNIVDFLFHRRYLRWSVLSGWMVLGWLFGFYYIYVQLLFDAEAVTVSAKVTRLAENLRSHNLSVDYEYETKQGDRVTGWQYVNQQFYDNTNVGDIIKVDYLPSDPVDSELSGSYDHLERGLIFVGSTILPCFLLGVDLYFTFFQKKPSSLEEKIEAKT